MKNCFAQIFSILCALILAVCAVSACAAEPATATDLPEQETVQPAEQEEKEAAQPAEQAEEATPAREESIQEPAGIPQEEEQPEENPREELPEAEDQETASQEQENPQAEPEKEAEKETEESRTSAELIISKAVRIGSTWEGLTKDTTPAILKLDTDKAQTVHLIVEGKKTVWVTVEKSDRPETTPQKTLSDPETKRVMISFEAEKGSYLIKIGPEEPNRNAKVIVTILDDEGYEVWLAALEAETEADQPELPEQPEGQEQNEPEQQEGNQPAETEPDNEVPGEGDEAGQESEPEADNPDETEPAEEPEGEETKNEPESVLPADRSIDVALTWDTEHPKIGDTAHLKATLNGYDNLSYTLQWQYSTDDQNWTDATGETNDSIDITISEENNYLYWRILVYIEQPAEA